MKFNYKDIEGSILDIKQDRRNECFNWGADNAYPSLVEGLIGMSVTSKACVDKVAKAIYGKSFGPDGAVIINKQGQSLNEILRVAAREYAKQNNIFIHVGYNGELDINSIKIVPNTHARKGKADDKGYSGKILVYSNWDKSESKKIEKSKFQEVDVYNPNKAVIESQIEAAGGIRKYKGQILHIQKDTSEVYSLSDLNPVLPECLLESNSQTFRSRGASKGFLNTKLLVVQPFAGEDERDEFTEDLHNLQGADNAGNVLLLEAANTTEDLKNQMIMEDLSSPYNDELFQYSDEQARKNIALAMGVPLQLIDVSDSSLFGNSGELLKTMKSILFESREEDRDLITEALQTLTSKWHEGNIPTLEIINPNTTN